MAAAAAASGGGPKGTSPAGGSPIEGISSVVVHPLVMLSVTDHYKRVAMNTKKRVVGMLLGHSHKGRVDVVNSFAVPFAEDPTDPKVWFLDHFYLDKMYKMFRKVASECPSGGMAGAGGSGPRGGAGSRSPRSAQAVNCRLALPRRPLLPARSQGKAHRLLLHRA